MTQRTSRKPRATTTATGTTATSTATSATEEARIVAHPDGYYWVTDDGRLEVGPFASAAAALADLRAADESGLEPVESLAEAEDEIGVADWIDPDTGEPAEDSTPRTEQH